MLFFPESCPFCHKDMVTEVYETHTWRACLDHECEYHGQPRYQVVWVTRGKLESETFMIGKYYVKIDYENNQTSISTLDMILLLGTITLPLAIDVNVRNYDETLTKIQTIITFS